MISLSLISYASKRKNKKKFKVTKAYYNKNNLFVLCHILNIIVPRELASNNWKAHLIQKHKTIAIDV